MPELPEVETVKRDLQKCLQHKRIKSIRIFSPKSIHSSVQFFRRELVGNSIKSVSRIGKLLVFITERPEIILLCHLKMTGQLIYDNCGKLFGGGHSVTKDNRDLQKLPNQWTRVSFAFADDSRLYFNDLRRFGFMSLVSKEELTIIKKRFGIEPLKVTFTFSAFCNALGRRKINLKAALLNQTLFSGIGNIYADESCFAAKILPSRLVFSLQPEEKKRLYHALQKIIQKAIAKRGTTFRNFVDGQGKPGNYLSYLKVYGQGGKKCQRCKKGIIQKKKVAGRGTHYCGECQQ